MVSGNRRVLVALLLFTFTAEAGRKHKLVALAPIPPPPEPAVVAPPPQVSPPKPTPIEFVRERRWGLFGGGVALFVAGWAIDIGVTYGMDHQPGALSIIPVIGPLIQMGDNWGTVPQMKSGNMQVDTQANQRIDQVNQAIQTGAYVILAVDCAFQLAGLTMAIVGASGRKIDSRYAFSPQGVRVSF